LEIKRFILIHKKYIIYVINMPEGEGEKSPKRKPPPPPKKRPPPPPLPKKNPKGKSQPTPQPESDPSSFHLSPMTRGSQSGNKGVSQRGTPRKPVTPSPATPSREGAELNSPAMSPTTKVSSHTNPAGLLGVQALTSLQQTQQHLAQPRKKRSKRRKHSKKGKHSKKKRRTRKKRNTKRMRY
jgi:hypothetical protein